MATIKEYCGCLPCLLMGYLDIHASIEHVTDCGRRVGNGADQHKWTIGLCGWHHFGTRMGHQDRHASAEAVGPSLAWGRTIFEDHFGDESHVLVPTQDFMLELFADKPWAEYSVARHAARDVRHHWIELNNAAR